MTMTAAALDAEIGSPPEWPGADVDCASDALWIALTYSFPVIAASAPLSAASRLFIIS